MQQRRLETVMTHRKMLEKEIEEEEMLLEKGESAVIRTLSHHTNLSDVMIREWSILKSLHQAVNQLWIVSGTLVG